LIAAIDSQTLLAFDALRDDARIELWCRRPLADPRLANAAGHRFVETAIFAAPLAGILIRHATADLSEAATHHAILVTGTD
jgi:hypothetical protein